MAEIYQSTGEQVALSGPGRVVGFEPRQAYDPSRQILDAAERQAAQQTGNIQALSNFSTSLKEFLVKKVEEKNKQQLASGYAKYIRGEVTLDPKAQKAFKVKTAILQAGAERDTAVANEVAASGTSPGTASTIVSASPALKGWEAYGAAVAAAQLAPSNLESFLYSKKNSTTPVILEDGRAVIPSEAKGYEIADVTRALTQQWVLEYGLDRINPQIIQEYSGYNLGMAERQVLSGWMKESDERELKNLQYNTKLEAINTLSGAISSPEQADIWQRTSFKNLNRVFRDPTVANEEQLKAIQDQLTVYRSSSDVRSMEKLLRNLYVSKIEGTNMTFGQKNRAKFDQFRAYVMEARKDNAGAANAEEEQRFNALLQQFQEIRRTGTPQQVATARKTLRETLINSGSPVINELLDKLSKQDSSLALTEQVRNEIMSGNKKPGGGLLWNQTAIDYLINVGDIEPEDGEELKKLLPAIMSPKELMDQSEPIVQKLVLSTVLQTLKDKGRGYAVDNSAYQKRIDGALYGAMQVAGDYLNSTKWGPYFEKTGKQPSADTVRRDWMNETLRRLQLPNQEFYIDEKGNTPNITKKGLATAPAKAPISPVASQAEIDALRAKAGPFPTVLPTKTVVPLEDFQLYQEIVANGGTLPAEVKAFVKMSGLPSEDAWLSYQAKQLGETYVPNINKEATYQRQAQINSQAANTLRNPRSTRSEIKRALQILNDGGTRRISTSENGFGAGDLGGLAELTSSGEGGFNSINYGTTGSASQLNLTNMTLNEVIELQESKQIGAAGFAQWTVPRGGTASNLRSAMNAAGLAPNDKMTRENQLKMFWAYILKTNKRPDLRDYIMGKHNDINRAQEAFAYEWAAAPGVDGKGKFDNDNAGNKATISSFKLRKALLNARKEYQQLLNSGIDPLSAF